MASVVVETTKRLLFENVSILQERYLEKAAKGGPRMMDRLQAAAGPHKSGDDPHIAGLALDIILFASDGRERFVADQLVQSFLDQRTAMKWISTIYNGAEWNSAGKKLPRGGDAVNRHVTHIHLQWRAADANHAGFETDLVKALKKVDDWGF